MTHANGTWYLAPANDRSDEHAAGYDANVFASRAEAEAQIPTLRACGEDFDVEWVAVQRATVLAKDEICPRTGWPIGEWRDLGEGIEARIDSDGSLRVDFPADEDDCEGSSREAERDIARLACIRLRLSGTGEVTEDGRYVEEFGPADWGMTKDRQAGAEGATEVRS